MPAHVFVTFKSYVSRLHDTLSLRRTRKAKPRLVISAPFDFKKEDSMCILPGFAGDELYMLREKAAASVVGSAVTIPSPHSLLDGGGSGGAYARSAYAGSAYAGSGYASDAATLAPPSSVHDLRCLTAHHQGAVRNRSTSSFASSRTGSVRKTPSSASLRLRTSVAAPQPGHRCCRRCKSATAAADDEAPPPALAAEPPSPFLLSPPPPPPLSLSPLATAAPAHRFISGSRSGALAFYPPRSALASDEPYAPTGLSLPSPTSSVASSITSRE